VPKKASHIKQSSIVLARDVHNENFIKYIIDRRAFVTIKVIRCLGIDFDKNSCVDDSQVSFLFYFEKITQKTEKIITVNFEKKAGVD